MQINQWLEERLVRVCKTCGKKWFKAIYLINSLIQLNSEPKSRENNVKISNGYNFVIFNYEDTTSCGLSRCFQNSYVHNLFIDHFLYSIFHLI